MLTNEVEKRLESFLDAYNNYEGANGVWVSGFFGSGKSHLLKMLALLLENRQIDGASALDLFLPKCGDNEILRGDLKRAVAIPSKSILFNIDQKADVISKTQIDALLAVFVKVFERCAATTVSRDTLPSSSATSTAVASTNSSNPPMNPWQAEHGKKAANRPCWRRKTSPKPMPSNGCRRAVSHGNTG